MDEHPDILKWRGAPPPRARSCDAAVVLTAVLAVVLLAAGCPITNVALVSVSNQTPTRLHVRARLRANPTFEDAMDLGPTEESALMKYEEGPFTVEPIEKLVNSLELVTPVGCVARLEDGPLTRASTRDAHATRWTIYLRPDDLPGIRCAGGARAASSRSPPELGLHPAPAPSSGPLEGTAPDHVTPANHVPRAPAPVGEEKQIKN
jgi:hypothetical protein